MVLVVMYVLGVYLDCYLKPGAIDARDAHDAHELQEVQRVPETKGRRGFFKEAVEGETGETVHRVRDPGRGRTDAGPDGFGGTVAPGRVSEEQSRC